MILIIDNYDSFTYNLASYFLELKQTVKVFRNDKITIKDIKNIKPQNIIISPGPCTPEKAGISVELVQQFYNTVPILGVCLGHQTIAAAFGGEVMRAKIPVHGMQDKIHYVYDEIFENIENPFIAARYHSLIVKKESLPDSFSVIAENKEGIIMAIKHKLYPCYGFQFHPESILTNVGKQLLKNFLHLRCENV